MLLASCTDVDKGGIDEGAVPETTAPTESSHGTQSAVDNDVYFLQSTCLADYLVIGGCSPYKINDMPPEHLYPKKFPYMIVQKSSDDALDLYDSIVSRELDLKLRAKEYSSSKHKIDEQTYKCDRSCLVDKENAEAYKTFFEAFTGVEYNDYYTDDFFDENIIFFTDVSEFVWPDLCMFEYSFDTQTNTLIVNARHIYYQGWYHCTHETAHIYYACVVIPKDAITVDGETVPLSELNVEFTGVFVIY